MNNQNVALRWFFKYRGPHFVFIGRAEHAITQRLENMRTQMTLTESAQELAIKRVTKAIDAIKKGGMVIMVDDEDRENEGDLVFAAEDASEHINFMAKEARGLICLPLGPEIAERLQLPLMTDHSKSDESMGTAFTVSIEAKHDKVTTGISAKDRAHTCLVAIDENSGPYDLALLPGHIYFH